MRDVKFNKSTWERKSLNPKLTPAGKQNIVENTGRAVGTSSHSPGTSARMNLLPGVKSGDTCQQLASCPYNLKETHEAWSYSFL